MKKSNASKIILIGFYILFTLLTGGLFILSIARPQNYLSTVRMGIQTVIFAVLFLGVFYLWKRFANPTLSSLKVFIPVLAAYWIFLYLVCVLHGNSYHVVGDYEILYMSALELADGKELSFAHYFMTYGNNTGPMILLAFLFRISHMVGLNEFYPALFFTSAAVIGSIWAVGELLTGDETPFGNGDLVKNFRIPVLLFTAVCLPLYVFTGAFYTDTFSFGLGVIAVALLKIGLSKKKAAWVLVPAGLITVLGAVWKVTALIFLIAVGITWVLYALSKNDREEKKTVTDNKSANEEGLESKNHHKFSWKRALIYAASVLVFAIIIKVSFQAVGIYRDSKQYANPTSAWLALGMRGNGSYSENVEFSDAVNELSTKEEKSVYINAYMKEHASEAFSISHLLSKAQNNFAGGTFTASDFTTNPSGHSILWNLMDPGGRFYYGCCGISFSYVVMVYLLCCIGGICALIRLVKGLKEDDDSKTGLPFYKIAADISFFGLFLFLMIWESNNRQLYNQLPVMILALFGSADLFFDTFPGKSGIHSKSENVKK
ncbi:MAG: hypothetical protein IKO32_09250 [Lachnospiraceae bacterium]|nr:hypothetical protein [Lachnospiraceae bacterium]